MQETCKIPRSCRDPKKRHPQNSLGCRIINTSHAHAHCDVRVEPGHEHPLRLRCPDPPSGYGTRRGNGREGKGPGPVVLRRKRMGLRRPIGVRLLVSYLIVLHGSLTQQLLLLRRDCPPARHTARDTFSACDRRARLTAAPRPPRPSPPQAPLPPANQWARLPYAPAPRGRSELGLDALATEIANQLAVPTRGAKRRSNLGEEEGACPSTNQKGASAPRPLPPPPAVSLWKPQEAKVAGGGGRKQEIE